MNSKSPPPAPPPPPDPQAQPAPQPVPAWWLGPVVVVNPPAPDPVTGPKNYPIGFGCRIAADGYCVDPIQDILEVWGWVNSAAKQAGNKNGRDWSFSAVGSAYNNRVNVFHVEVKAKLLNGGSGVFSASQEFYGTGGSSACNPPPPPAPAHAGAGAETAALEAAPAAPEAAPVAPVIPRYYRLTVEHAAGAAPPPARTFLFGGLLEAAAVHLAYDLPLSSPAEPVWRDINLPPAAGCWTLRVREEDGRLIGELLLQQTTDTHVYPPVVYRSETWDFRGPNILKAVSRTRPGLGPAVRVEPE